MCYTLYYIKQKKWGKLWEKNQLIDITVDGIISEDEKEDFERIKVELSQISMAVNSLSLWVEEAIIDGKIK